MIKRAVTLLSAVTLCVVIGLSLPRLLSGGAKPVTDYEAGDWQVKDQMGDASTVERGAGPFIDDTESEAEATESETDTTEPETDATEAIDGTTEPVVGTKKPVNQDTDAGIDSEVEETSDIEDQVLPAGNDALTDAVIPSYTGYDFLDEAIHNNQDVIDPGDLTIGLRLMKQLNMDYLLGLAGSGMTDEHKLEAKTYLDTVLTPDEVVVMMRLLQNYAHLL